MNARGDSFISVPIGLLSCTTVHSFCWLQACSCSLAADLKLLKKSRPCYTLRLALGGPLVPDVRLPPVHRAPPLPAGESTAWEVSLRVTAFGRLRVQPLLTLPARSATLPGA